MSKLEETLAMQIKALKLPEPKREHRFHPTRRWRFDFAFVEHKLAVEVEGGGWMNGRHNRPSGFRGDMDKYHAAMELGWTVYRCDGHLVRSGQAAQLIEKLLGVKDETGQSSA